MKKRNLIKKGIEDQVNLFFVLIGIIVFACALPSEPKAVVTVPHNEVEITYHADNE